MRIPPLAAVVNEPTERVDQYRGIEEKTKAARSDRTSSRLRQATALTDDEQLAAAEEPKSIAANGSKRPHAPQVSIQTDEGQSVAARRGTRKSSVVPVVIVVVGIVGLCALMGGGYVIVSSLSSQNADDPPQPEGASPALPESDNTNPSGEGPKGADDGVAAVVDASRVEAMARQFTVRLQVRTEAGERFGSGFIINRQGWVLTSRSLLRDASSVAVQFETGAGVAAAGLVAEEEKYDLAVLSATPTASFAAAVVRDGEVTNGEPVFLAKLAPAGSDWLRRSGGAKQVNGNTHLPPSTKTALRERNLNDTPAVAWIQHDMRPDAESEGGPLLDGQGQVVGVSMNLGDSTGKGYAIHGQHIKALIDWLPAPSSATIKPFKNAPPPPAATPQQPPIFAPPIAEPPPVAPSRDPVDEQIADLAALRQQCQALGWYPATAEQYTQFEKLAEKLNLLAAGAEQNDLPAADRQRLQTAVEAVLAAELDWSDLARQHRVSELAAAAINREGGRGLFAFAEVKLTTEQINVGENKAAGLQPIGSDDLWIVRVTNGAEELTAGSRWLIFGVFRQRLPASGPETPELSVIEAKYLLEFPADP